jgi:hypothetical protein
VHILALHSEHISCSPLLFLAECLLNKFFSHSWMIKKLQYAASSPELWITRIVWHSEAIFIHFFCNMSCSYNIWLCCLLQSVLHTVFSPSASLNSLFSFFTLFPPFLVVLLSYMIWKHCISQLLVCDCVIYFLNVQLPPFVFGLGTKLLFED